MAADKKIVFKTASLLSLLIVGFFLIKEIKYPQLFQKRAAGNFVDEIFQTIGDHNLQYLNGALVSQAEEDKIMVKRQSATTQAAGAERLSGAESRLTLPSISAFSSSLYSGTAEVSYPIATFPGLGGLTPSLSLNYSSGAVDDLHLYRGMWSKDDYEAQAGVAGLGWDIGGTSYIARDNTTNPNSFFLVFSGGSTKLFRVDETTNLWQSNPKLFIKIYHKTNTGDYYDTNTWQVTTQDGTVYTFGSPLNETPRTNIPVGAPIDEAMTPLTIAKRDPGDCDAPNNYNANKYTPYKWYLREVNDLNGNKITYEYDKNATGNYYGACSQDKGFTTATYLKRVNYNYVGGVAKTIIDLTYESRPDIHTLDWLRFHRNECKAAGLNDAYCDSWAGMIQYRAADSRLKQISITVNSQLARKYVLDYDLSQGSQRTIGGFPHPGHSLLKSITLYGTDGNSPPLPPYTFTYWQGNLNDVYLKTATNGYGGMVTYDEYKDYNVEYCASDKNCGGEGKYGSTRHALTKTTSTDGEGNSFQKTYDYASPKAYVKTAINTNATDDCNACYDGCEGDATCRASCDAYYKSQDKCGGYTEPFTGFEFLGFADGSETLYGLNNASIIESSSKSYFHQVLSGNSCFEVDPRKGRAYRTETLGSGGNVLTANEVFYDPARTDSSCRTTIPDGESIFVKQVQANNLQIDPSIGNKVTASRTFYNDTWGIVGRVESLGEVTLPDSNNHRQIEDIPGDETYAFTFYTYNSDKWIVKPRQTYISNKVLADGINGDIKYNNTFYYYDSAASNTAAPIVGLLTKKTLNDDSYSPTKDISTTYEYLANGQPKKTTDALGGTNEIFYDNILGIFPVATKNALGQIARTEYWGKDFLLGVPTVQKDIAERMTKTEYDSFGRVRAVYNPSETDPKQPESTPSVTYEYFDSLTKPYIRIRSKVFGENYQISDQIYNGFGWLLQSQVLSTFVDVDQTGSKSEKGLLTQTKYNSQGQKIEESLPIVVAARDSSSPPSIIAVSGYDKNSTSYDALGRATSVTDALGRTSRNEYQNFETRVIDFAGHKASSQTDGLGRTISTFGYQGDFGASSGKRINVQTAYDVLGNSLQTTQTFPDNPGLGPFAISSTYDRLGRKTETNDPDLGKWIFVYDDKNRLSSQTNAKGERISLEYDALDRLIKKTYPNKPYSEALNNVVAFAYDACSPGKRCHMDDLTGYTQWEYDTKGRIAKMTKMISKNITGTNDETAAYEYTYYPTNQTKTYRYPDGELVNYTYDKYGNQLTATGAEQYLIDIAANKFGSPTKVTFGHGFSQNLVYDTVNRLDTLTFNNGDNRLYRDEFSRDSLSNILGINHSSGDGTSENFTYTYDSLSQLKNVGGTFTASYEYDEAGDMKAKNEDSNITIAYSNDFPAHAPKKVNDFAYRYDSNGNMLEDKLRLYEWDFDNKPLKITTKQSGVETRFFYDGEGERVAKKGVLSGANPSCSGGDLGNLNCSLDGKIDQADLDILLDYWTGDGEVRKETEGTHTSDLNGDKKVDEIDYSMLLKNWGKLVIPTQTPQTILYFPSYEKMVDTGEVSKYYSVGSITLQRIIKAGQNKLYYLVPDHLGSTRVIIDKDKTETSYLSYYPYGSTRTYTNPNSALQNFYTGQKQDSETDLYYYHARYYNPAIGHFVSADKAQGPNRYAYVGNNPIMLNDPSGNMNQVDDGGVSSNLSLSITGGFDYPGLYATGLLSSDATNKIIFNNKYIVNDPIKTIIPNAQIYPGYNADFDNPYFKELENKFNVSNEILNSEYDYAVSLTHRISKEITYDKKTNNILFNQQKAREDRTKSSATLSDRIKTGRAVCLENALLLHYFLNESGIQNDQLFVIDEKNDFNHTVISATIESNIYLLDPTNDMVSKTDNPQQIKTQLDKMYSTFGFLGPAYLFGKKYNMEYHKVRIIDY